VRVICLSITALSSIPPGRPGPDPSTPPPPQPELPPEQPNANAESRLAAISPTGPSGTRSSHARRRCSTCVLLADGNGFKRRHYFYSFGAGACGSPSALVVGARKLELHAIQFILSKDIGRRYVRQHLFRTELTFKTELVSLHRNHPSVSGASLGVQTRGSAPTARASYPRPRSRARSPEIYLFESSSHILAYTIQQAPDDPS